METHEIRQGSIARCGHGTLGLITSAKPKLIKFRDGSSAIAWTGIHLTNQKSPIGSYWCSRNPIVLGHIDEITQNMKSFVSR